MGEALLEVRDLRKSFPGVRALDGVRFRLERGSVHALCGGNGAGKSTFLAILMGITERDAGTIELKGREVAFATPAEALAAGISIIQQELSPVPDMTVAENIFLGREPTTMGVFVDRAKMRRDTAKLLAELDFHIDPGAKMRDLSLAQQQLVEIAKALSHEADVIVMDEPTSAIGEEEVEHLFQAIRKLAAQGRGIIYVSHRLAEIFAIADSYTVFRDGAFIDTGAIPDIDRATLIREILGRDLAEEFVKENVPRADVLLRVEGFGRAGKFQDISLDLRAGEILGIYGLMGSGRSEFFDCLFGLEPADAGTVEIEGRPVRIRNAAEAMRHGLALVTEDRKGSGLVMTANVRQNIALASLERLSTRVGFLKRRDEQADVVRMIDYFNVRTPSPEVPVRNLSGGNQQKVVLGRWLLTEPRILLMDEPTRGIDVAAKREVYAFMSRFAAAGNGVIMVTSELPEVLGMADRIVVFKDGRIAGIVARAEASQEELVHMAA